MCLLLPHLMPESVRWWGRHWTCFGKHEAWIAVEGWLAGSSLSLILDWLHRGRSCTSNPQVILVASTGSLDPKCMKKVLSQGYHPSLFLFLPFSRFPFLFLSLSLSAFVSLFVLFFLFLSFSLSLSSHRVCSGTLTLTCSPVHPQICCSDQLSSPLKPVSQK